MFIIDMVYMYDMILSGVELSNTSGWSIKEMRQGKVCHCSLTLTLRAGKATGSSLSDILFLIIGNSSSQIRVRASVAGRRSILRLMLCPG